MVPNNDNVKQVVNPSGQQGVTTTVEVVNQVQGQNQLIVTFDNSGGGATDYAPFLFPGIWKLGPVGWAATKIPSTVTFTSPSGHGSYEEMIWYFSQISTNVAGCRIETSDIANFGQGAFFQFYEKQPDGSLGQPVKHFISTYRQPLGTGYALSMDIAPARLSFIMWPGFQILLPIIKAGTSMTFYFNIYGWNKVKNLMPLRNNSLG